MRLVILFSASLLLTHCASKKEVTVSLEEAPKMEKNLKSTTSDRAEKVGVKDGTVKIQKTIYLEEDLTKMQREIEDLENRVYGESRTYPGGMFLALKECRGRLSDARLGGNGVPEPMEKWEKVSEKNEDYNYHVDKEQNVVAVNEEELATRITNLRKLKRILADTYDSFQTRLDNCQQKLQAAMVSHGINPDDAKSKGEWVEGPNGYKVWRLKRPASTDPEELMKRKGEREKNSAEEND
ncbi:MAG: hypothetical protein ACKOA8_08260 [Deltaproteobacteria bacterium]